jgi:predicted permease
MTTILLQLLPVFAYFFLGMIIRRAGLGDRSQGDFLLRLVFFVTLPLLIINSVPTIAFTTEKAVLPFLNIGVNLFCLAATVVLAKSLKLDRKTLGTMLVCTTIVNNSFMFPFILAVYGQAGFADAILFDFGNAVMMATLVYGLAFSFSDEQTDRWTMLKRIMKSPLIWSLIVSVILSLTGTPLPGRLVAVISPLAQMTAPLILIALGLHFSMKFSQLNLALVTVTTRMAGGLLAGLLLATIFGLEGVTKNVVILCSSAPIGFNALTYCSLAKLDPDLGASAVSISIFTGLVSIPALILLLN